LCSANGFSQNTLAGLRRATPAREGVRRGQNDGVDCRARRPEAVGQLQLLGVGKMP
jgi:hypothetical protein